MKKVVVILSGGMDSSLTAYIMKNRGYEIVPLHFSYGQRTEKRELQAFHDISNSLNVIGRYTIQLPFFKDIGIGTTSLIDRDMQINEKGVSTSSIPNSYVPFRNGIMLSIATAVAEKEGAEGIAIGVVEEDSSGYPDCRENFISTFEKSINLGTKQGKFRIFRPLVNLHKSEIVREAIRYGVPLHLTWSCYQREDKACGVCDSCRLRLNGFKLAGVKDPIEYVENTKYKG
ncbi:MAG TPA: 7-cyano-7-deazaguanine synthase QueC [Campylobacterales bacterium]|nr:7-cyano-7-deazaguanine synthase QueC [Campylobacterales bacterium]